MRDHSELFIQYICDGHSHDDVFCLSRPDVDQGTGCISRFHGTGQDGVYLIADEADTHQEESQNNYQRNQKPSKIIPYSFYVMIHSLPTFDFVGRSGIAWIESGLGKFNS
ncbi:hypothetical protein SDC9_167688 [bioreactor metagenome]|uniref:Uncharacterized protein n=1 Tax=bioreactor metagenome TaxID=1076179 RepID=A0A645G326_9ZZZZ